MTDHEAAVCTALDGPGSVTTMRVPDEPLTPGYVRVAVRAAGVNYPDYLLTRGEYQLKLEPPFVPGMEVAGVVAESHPDQPGQRRWPPGTPVIAMTRTGGFSQEVVVPSEAVFGLPEGFSPIEGATFLVATQTAYHALVARAALRSGETVAVLGATGGVGMAAVQLARELGATVVGIGSDGAKLAVTKDAGAQHVVNYRTSDLVEAVRDSVGRADVVFDPVGGDLATEALRLLDWGGRYLVVGFAAGTIPRFEANRILLKGASILGVRAGEAARRDPRSAHREVTDLLSLAARGSLRPHVSHRFPLAEAGAALATLAERRVVGRAVLTNGDTL
ncbi:NADPH:quinone oxidoreductase family protein [Amycolatopsis pithecellobii]|uniref:Zinc-binding dehydrogenase n=1 Tax=Amycolatopsis pithecellobii TaxID=664692 RepID=A0A6N7Z2U6_9PSEU|nr:NADPH:quinone oxidoreductase family protein [Amycolatopsis pithecellobii]MTD53086.1 zinc-binding dehydrogenase [Amycolatopsis pithecellobii]